MSPLHDVALQRGVLHPRQIRGMNVEEALAQLEFSPKKSAKFIQKVTGDAETVLALLVSTCQMPLVVGKGMKINKYCCGTRDTGGPG